MAGAWIAIDWGTSNFRAWLINDKDVLDKRSANCGLLHVGQGQFDATLKTLLGDWLTHAAPVIVMAGMVGSQQGWHDVDYCPIPAGVDSLISRSKYFITSWGSEAWIIPGLRQSSSGEIPDVMRGEEVQLLGLALLAGLDDFQAILPGTHSKHARVRQRQVTDFSTYMTGELYHLLLAHSLLGRALPEAVEDESAFARRERCPSGPAVKPTAFSARTLRLSGELPASSVGDYLSGLLMGAEFTTDYSGQIWLVGSAALTRRYQLAATVCGVQTRCIDGDRCFIAGMQSLQHQLTEKRNGQF